MGYDMNIETPDPGWLQRERETSGVLYGPGGLYDLRNKGEIPADSPELAAAIKVHEEAEKHTYFRLNIWGMSNCRRYMHERGMVFDAPRDALSPWPELSDFGLEEYPDDWNIDVVLTDQEKAFLAAGEKVRAEVVVDHPGIPLHKLGSNDGWLVTPIECQGALDRLRQWREKNPDAPLPTWTDENGRTELVTWWPEWLEFLVEAAEHGGFRVY